MLRKNRLVLALLILLLVSSLVLVLRKPVLDYVVGRVQSKVFDRYGAQLLVGDAGFLGFRDVYLHDVALIPPGSHDTLFSMESLKARIRIGRLLRGQVAFRELVVDTVKVNLVKADSISNYAFLFKRKSADPEQESKSDAVGFNERMEKVLSVFNDIFNENITIRQFKVYYTNARVQEMISVPELFFDGHDFKSNVITSSVEGVNLWNVSGVADAENDVYDFRVKRLRGAAFALPLIDLFDGFKVCFDEAHVHLQSQHKSNPLPFDGDFDVKNLLVNHWRISPVDVQIPEIKSTLRAVFAEDSVNFNAGTGFVLGKLPVQITAAYVRKPDPIIRFDAGFATANAQDLFSALPAGMFRSFDGFAASGSLDYKLHFMLPRKEPGKLEFESGMQKKNFRILHYGIENFSAMNGPFTFLAMDGETPVRNIVIGPENPNFTPYDQIPECLKNAVLTCEDPSFFNHRGFVLESFRESIVTNLRKGRFARGGSTISMQLVKNVHLNRNKTISRKIEEALIVWIIEQNGLVSKERMFETYLNIIEWGPNVYGIGEAARFYFSKAPRDLTLAESIYLGSIIPHPKHFRSSFDSNGQLKPYMANFFKLVSGRLVKREKITQAEADSLQPNVVLTGEALRIVLPPDTTAVPDSLELVPELQ